MLICKKGNFSLRHAVYLDHREVKNTDINICKEFKDGSNFVIADFDEEGQLTSCGNRLLEEIQNEEDLKAVKVLNQIAQLILKTED